MRKTRLLIIATMLAVAFNSYAQWIDLTGNKPNPTTPLIEVHGETQLSFTVYGFNKSQITMNSEIFDVISFPASNASTANIGYPQLPILPAYMEISGNKPVVDIDIHDSIVLNGYNIVPLQNIFSNDDTLFYMNDDVYNTNEFFPLKILETSRAKSVRGHKISPLYIMPARHNPITQQLIIYTSFDITVSNGSSSTKAFDNTIFNTILQSNVMNFDENIRENEDMIKDLLIITPDEYYSALLPYKSWKERSGYRTKITTKSALINEGFQWFADSLDNNIYQGIDAYIKNAYDQWGAQAPEYLLLVGETDRLPTHYWTFYSGNHIGTDYYYTTMDTTNLPDSVNWINDFPDILCGRLSVDNANELNVIIDKILQYEIDPYIESNSWYNNMTFGAAFEAWVPYGNSQDFNDSTDMRFFIQTSEIISNYLILSHEYNINKRYTKNTPKENLYYNNGEPIPDSIYFYPLGSGDQPTSDIIEGINNGRTIINHRDHGSSQNSDTSLEDGWSCPSFKTYHIPQLQNGKMLPVMFSINCQTGWFDGATDEYEDRDHDCFGEELLTYQEGGVVGFLGASRTSYSGYNDEYFKGLYDAMFPGLDPYNSLNQDPAFDLGSVMLHGKLFSYDKYILGNSSIQYPWETSAQKSKVHFEEHHILGDPTLKIRNKAPEHLYVDVNYTENIITVFDENNQPFEKCEVSVIHGSNHHVFVTNENGCIYPSFDITYTTLISTSQHNCIPVFNTPIVNDTTIDHNFPARGDFYLQQNTSASYTGDIIIPKYAQLILESNTTLNANRIIIEEGAEVLLGNNVTINGLDGSSELLVYEDMVLPGDVNIGINTIVKNNNQLTIANASTFVLHDYASLVIENEANLLIEDNATIKGRNLSNKVKINGTLQTGNNIIYTSYSSFETWKGVELNNDQKAYVFGDASFINCDLSGDCKTLSISNSTFEEGGIIMIAENATISNSNFTNGGIEIFNPGNRHATGVHISGCSITGILDTEAKGGIVVKDHPEFSISNNSITNNNCDGISIINSGIETGDHSISGNTISGNTGEYNVAGIRVYQSYAEIKENNIITNNENGVICLNNSNVRLQGFEEAQYVGETQQIMNNDENQVHASSNSFPVYFRFNAVIDEDNTMPLVYFRAQEEEHVDVAYNFWGNNFDPGEDFYPAELFDYEPVWELEYLQENPGPAEMLYTDATQEMQTGNYSQAEAKYKQVVQQYPASKFSKSSLKVLLLLEELNNNNYNQLQNYYSGPQLQNNSILKKLASRLSNNCDIKMEDYPSAITWFEAVIQNPETLEDSVFAIIDLENLYLMMEESGKSSYQGKMVEFIPESREAHYKHRAELLSLLGGEQSNAITAAPAKGDAKATKLVTLEPNPFSNHTTINCQISKPAYVNISIYSLTGQKVLDVADGYKEKGQYRFDVSAKHLPEGIYVYSLQMDGTIKERGKVVLVR